MAPILANADVQERLLPYLPSGESLPQTAEEIQNTLTSPQFQQVDAVAWVPPAVCSVVGDGSPFLWLPVTKHPCACHWPRHPTPRGGPLPSACSMVSGFPLQALGMFSAALASGQLGPLMCQFGLPAEAVEAANKGGKCLSPLPPHVAKADFYLSLVVKRPPHLYSIGLAGLAVMPRWFWASVLKF